MNMKISNKKKNQRKAFFHKGRRCTQCGEVINESGHFVPALGIWTCSY